MPTIITVENEYQRVVIEDKDHGSDICASDFARLLYLTMLALEYHPETCKKMFSDEVEI